MDMTKQRQKEQTEDTEAKKGKKYELRSSYAEKR